MGVYSNNTELMKPLNFPSVFEYYRKFSSPSKSAINAWWVSDQAGPFTYLNYSDFPGYGPAFGANMIQPTTFFSKVIQGGFDWSADQYEQISELQAFFNRHAKIDPKQLNRQQIENVLEDRVRIEQLILKLNRQFGNFDFSPWETGKSSNEDLATMYTATEIIKEFQPELLVVNMQHSDIGHSNFTKYCSNLRKADFALRQLWETIQSTPGMKDDTILIVAPEFGRNLQPNTLKDEFGRFAVDHTGDELSQKIFCLIAGPPSKVKQGLRIPEGGQTIDLVPTVLKILGVDVPPSFSTLTGRFLEEAFV
jgi:arylsulfatase A-like enzyme